MRVFITNSMAALWLVACVAGGVGLWRYNVTPGVAGNAPHHWPVDSALTPGINAPTLLLFVHPNCPCARASLAELATIVARHPGTLRSYVIFVNSPGLITDRVRTALWRSAATTPTVIPRSDDGGVEACRFGVQTSGHVLLFAADGRRLFSGGITGARGETGDNPGQLAILQWAGTGASPCESAPVFGCPLFETDGRCHSGDQPCRS